MDYLYYDSDEGKEKLNNLSLSKSQNMLATKISEAKETVRLLSGRSGRKLIQIKPLSNTKANWHRPKESRGKTE